MNTAKMMDEAARLEGVVRDSLLSDVAPLSTVLDAMRRADAMYASLPTPADADDQELAELRARIGRLRREVIHAMVMLS